MLSTSVTSFKTGEKRHIVTEVTVSVTDVFALMISLRDNRKSIAPFVSK